MSYFKKSLKFLFYGSKELRRITVMILAHLSFEYACICTNNLLLRLVNIRNETTFSWRRGLMNILTQCVNETYVNCNHLHVDTIWKCVATADFFLGSFILFFRFQSQTNNYHYIQCLKCMHEYCDRAKALWIIIIKPFAFICLMGFGNFFLLWAFIGQFTVWWQSFMLCIELKANSTRNAEFELLGTNIKEQEKKTIRSKVYEVNK